MRFAIEIDSSNASFMGDEDQPDPGPELARILRELASELEHDVASIEARRLYDISGNSIGYIRLSLD